jgi:tetratricopeptide (TPR) repeat protein
MRASKAVLAVTLAGLLAMFAWSFLYRAQNPSLTAALDTRGAQAPGGESGSMGGMGAMGGPAMKAVVEAMAKLKENPDDPEALHMAAEAFAEAEMWDKADQMAEKGLSKNPADKELLNLRGVILFRLERPAEALKAFEELLKLDPANVHAKFNLGAVYKFGLQDPDKARPYFEAVVADPKAESEIKEQARQELAGGGK